MRSGFTNNYAERNIERFTVTLCSKQLVSMHNVSLNASEKTSAPDQLSRTAKWKSKVFIVMMINDDDDEIKMHQINSAEKPSGGQNYFL